MNLHSISSNLEGIQSALIDGYSHDGQFREFAVNRVGIGLDSSLRSGILVLDDNADLLIVDVLVSLKFSMP